MKRLMAHVLLSGLLSASAYGNFLTHPLVGHVGTIVSGTTPFTGFALNSEPIDINVDYAVYAPGNFPGTGGVFNPFGGFPALNPADYVYAYQIYNVGPLHGGNSAVDLSSLNIVFGVGTVDSLGYDLNYDPDPADINATLAFNFPPTASYLFTSPALGVDKFSAVLLLSTPQPPTFNVSNVIDGGQTVEGTLPSPVPSPASGLLGLLSLGLLGGVRRRRQVA